MVGLVQDCYEELDELDFEVLHVVGGVDEDCVFDVVPVGSIGDHPYIGQLPVGVEEDRLRPGLLVQGGDECLVEVELHPLDGATVWNFDLRLGSQAALVLPVAPRLDEAGVEAMRSGVDLLLIARHLDTLGIARNCSQGPHAGQ